MRLDIRTKNEQSAGFQYGRRVSNAVKAVMQAKGNEVARLLERKVKQGLRGRFYKRRSGQLLNSVKATAKATQQILRIKLTATAPYAKILHDGGRIPPHKIFAQGKALKFRMKARGKAVYAASVNHPGAVFKGKPFMGIPLKEARPEITLMLKQALVKEISK